MCLMLAGGSTVEAPMNYPSFQRERLILADPMDPRLRRNVTIRDHVVAALNDSELVAIALFCTLGLVVTLGLYFLFPGFGALAASLQAFL
jgi:hypothetical protein